MINSNLYEHVRLRSVIVPNVEVNDESYKFLHNSTVYRATVDLTQYDWYDPSKVIAILPSQGYRTDWGNHRCLVIPDVSNVTSQVFVYAPVSQVYTLRLLLLEKD